MDRSENQAYLVALEIARRAAAAAIDFSSDTAEAAARDEIGWYEGLDASERRAFIGELDLVDPDVDVVLAYALTLPLRDMATEEVRRRRQFAIAATKGGIAGW